MPNVTLHFSDSTAILSFDREDGTASLLDMATLGELTGCLAELVDRTDVTGLLIRSDTPDHFIAGIDLKELSALRNESLARLITMGQALFNILSDLPYPTVAAIHGACVGGGYELALACDWRVASDSPSTQIGLPQTRFGMLPAWGGATRLPHLLGLQDSLSVILSGKLHRAADAKRLGLVDEVVPGEHLDAFARVCLDRGKRSLSHNPIVHNQAVARLIRVQVQKEVQKKARGLHAGLTAALEVATASIGHTRAQSQQAELDAVKRLSELPETANLIRFSLLRERAETRRQPAAPDPQISRVAVIGCGMMGSAIACWISARDTHTILQDITNDALAQGMESIASLYADSTAGHLLSPTEAARGLDRIVPMVGNVSLKPCDLVIEAAVEELSVKQTIFADLAARTRNDTILATNTSGLPIHELAACVSHPQRLVGLHFFHPVHRMELVEVVRTRHTSDETLTSVCAYVRKIGKLPVVVADSPGFLVNRILMPYLVRAVEMFEQGGDPEDIDNAMLDYGMPVGPLRLLDEAGLDVMLNLARTLATAFPKRMKIPGVVERLVEQGHTGRKGGSGFYVYDTASPAVNAQVIPIQCGTEAVPEDIQQTLSGLMLREAELCIEEGVAASSDDVELALILGAGYPSFRGGLSMRGF